MFTETVEPSDEAIILPTSSVDVTDVSRMGFDLRRNAVVGDRNKVDPDKADKRFVELMVKVLEKVHAPSSSASSCTECNRSNVNELAAESAATGLACNSACTTVNQLLHSRTSCPFALVFETKNNEQRGWHATSFERWRCAVA